MVLRIAALGAAVFLSLASADPAGGDRTRGDCPPGEVCSPETPDGLYVGGATLGDQELDPVDGLVRTAVGGTQTLTVFLDEDGTREFVGFNALAAGPSFEVVAVTGSRIGVKGVRAGTDFLRFVDPQNGELYDRLPLETADVATVAVVPVKLDLLGDQALHESPRPDVVYSTRRTTGYFVVALHDAVDVRLADESMTLQLGGGFVRDVSQWDRFRQTQGFAPGTYELGVTLGNGEVHALAVTFVDKADRVTWVAGNASSERQSPDKGILARQAQRYCFRAESAGRPVIGEQFVYSVSGPLQISDPTPSSCVTLRAGGTAGTGQLTVLAGDGVLTVEIPVRAAKQAARAGERAVSDGASLD